MTDDTRPPAAPESQSAFLPDTERSDAHIIDVLIEERCPHLRAHWSWPLIRPPLYTLLGYKGARNMADKVMQMDGRQSFGYLSSLLDIQLDVSGLERIPGSGRLIIACNHPTGLADGIAVWDAVRRVREDIVFFANADALRVNMNFKDVIIPVEWVTDKRTPAKTRETLRRAGEAFEAEKCVILFPSGKLARKIDGKLTEQDWFSTVVSLARKKKAPILPMHVDATNSRLYYLLAQMNPELRDITLFNELLNKKRAHFSIQCGPLIMPDKLQSDANILTDKLKNYVAYGLKGNSDAEFAP